jgi:hypothetical protein
MDREIKAWLFDILNSIEEIEQFLPQGQQLFEAYKKYLKTKRAVERNLEIIGEATNGSHLFSGYGKGSKAWVFADEVVVNGNLK